MFRGLQSNQCLIKSINILFDRDALHGSQVLRLQFVRGNAAMAAADGAAGASTKILKMENARDLFLLKDLH